MKNKSVVHSEETKGEIGEQNPSLADISKRPPSLCPRCGLATMQTDSLLNMFCPRCGYGSPGTFT